jgi:ubiquinone/menaquinone biosynthesis C-methylase UbiE
MSDDYRRIAPWYDVLLGPFIRSLRPTGFRLFRPGRHTNVLEVGCGTGMQLALFRAQGCRVTGIDLSTAMLRVARARLDRGTLVCRGDAARLPYPAETFDLVMATLVLHEMDPAVRSAVVEDMLRVIGHHGRLGIIDYHPQPRPSLKGAVASGIIRGIERAAGRRHYTNFRHFRAAGGIPGLAARHGLHIEGCQRVSGGNIGIYRLRRMPPGEGPEMQKAQGEQ